MITDRLTVGDKSPRTYYNLNAGASFDAIVVITSHDSHLALRTPLKESVVHRVRYRCGFVMYHLRFKMATFLQCCTSLVLYVVSIYINRTRLFTRSEATDIKFLLRPRVPILDVCAKNVSSLVPTFCSL